MSDKSEALKRAKSKTPTRKPFGYIPKRKKEKLPKNPIIPGKYPGMYQA